MQTDIILMSPPSRAFNHYRPPLSLIYLGGYLKHKGLKVKLIDIPLTRQIRNKRFFKDHDKLVNGIRLEMIREYNKHRTKYVGISCMSPEYDEVVNLIKTLKILTPKVKVIIGGIHPTLKPNDFNGIAHTVIRGEGEVALYDTINDDLHGVLKGKQHDLDDISFPDYSLVDMEYYTQANPYAIRGVFVRPAYVSSSRGCPSQCTFCVAKSLREFTGVRFRSEINLCQEINHLKDTYKIDGFYLIDDLFTLDKRRVLNFCTLVTHLGLIWGCSSRITTVDEQMIKAMASAGCVQMDFGVERGDDLSLLELNKRQTVKQIKEVFKLCQKHKVRTFANLLVNIPGEITRDLQDIKKLLKGLRSDVISVNVFRGYLGTQLKDQTPSTSILEWASVINKQFNSLWRNLRFHLSLKYISVLFRAKRKMNYLKQMWLLIREAVNQK